MVQQEENDKRMMSNRDQRPETMAAYAMSHITRPNSMQGERVICKPCGKIGCEELNYYELVGYPPRWGSRGGRGARGRGCGTRGGRGGCTRGRGTGREVAYAAADKSME